MKIFALQLFFFCFSVVALAQDPTKVAPEAYKTEFENEYVRVQRVRYAPHVKLPEHDHALYGTAYVYLNDAGPVVFQHVGLAYGAVIRPAVKASKSVAGDNIGKIAAELLRFDFKTPPMKKAEADKPHDHSHKAEENAAKAKANADSACCLLVSNQCPKRPKCFSDLCNSIRILKSFKNR